MRRAALALTAALLTATVTGSALACTTCNGDDGTAALGGAGMLNGERWMSQLSRAQQAFSRTRPVEALTAAGKTDTAVPSATPSVAPSVDATAVKPGPAKSAATPQGDAKAAPRS